MSNEFDNACFSMPYGDFNDLQGITSSNKSIREAACNAPNNTQYDKYQEGLSSTVYKFLMKI